MHDREKDDVKLKFKEKKTRWDFLSCLKPPENLSIESGNIYQIVQLSEASPDYEYVSQMFMNTFNGQNAQPVNPFGAMMPAPVMNPAPYGKKVRGVMPAPAMPPAMFGGGGGGIIGNGRVP